MLKSVYYGIVPRALTKTNIRGPSWRNRVTTVGVVYTGHFRRGASATSRVIARAGPTRLPSHAFREHVRLWLAFILSSKLLTHDSANVIAHYSSLLNFYSLYNAFSCLRRYCNFLRTKSCLMPIDYLRKSFELSLHHDVRSWRHFQCYVLYITCIRINTAVFFILQFLHMVQKCHIPSRTYNFFILCCKPRNEINNTCIGNL